MSTFGIQPLDEIKAIILIHIDFPDIFLWLMTCMRDGFFNFDDEPSPVVREVNDGKPKKYLPDPRESGGVLVETHPVDKAKCSICDQKLSLDIFYFEGKMRRFVRCEGCKQYLFEIEKKKKKTIL